jgi:phenylacetate-coenzyme A ligase PaaK-like adenylate-forming protein
VEGLSRIPSAEQFEKIRALCFELWDSRRSDFYREFWGKRGFNPAMLKEPRDFLNIPVLRKSDLLEAQKRSFDAYLYFPELAQYMRATGGTTSKEEDDTVLITFQNDELKYALKSSVKNIYKYPKRPLVLKPAWGAVRDTAQFIKAGAMPIIGDVFDLKRSAYMAQKAKVDGVFGHPPLVIPLIETLEKEYGYGRENIRYILLEAGSRKEFAALRRLLPHAYILSGFGLSEFGISIGMWCEYVARADFEEVAPYIHLYSSVFMEILPPGEIVITPLVRTAAPLIRYATGDRGVMWFEKKCPCGNPGPLFRFAGRIRSDLIAVGGFSFWKREFEKAIGALENALQSQFRVIVGEELVGNTVKPKIIIEVIPKSDILNPFIIGQQIAERIAVSGRHTLSDAIAAGLCLPIEVRFVDNIPEGEPQLVSRVEY